MFAIVLVAALMSVSSGAARVDDDAGLLVNPFGGPRADPLHVLLSAGERPVAEVALASPPGYTPHLNQQIGTELGYVNLGLLRLDRKSFTFGGGRLIVDDPARYTSDTRAEACAPGPHAVVWSTEVSAYGLPRLPIFVDPSPLGGDFGVTLRFCPAWRADAGFRVAATSMEFTASSGLEVVPRLGENAWAALVSPVGSALEPDESKTIELRAFEPVPYAVTLRARHMPAKAAVVLSGRVTAAGAAVKNAEVGFGVVRRSLTSGAVPFVGPARTDASGRFVFRTRIEETTTYLAQVQPILRPCSTASAAPAGCISEFVPSPSDLASVRVRVRKTRR